MYMSFFPILGVPEPCIQVEVAVSSEPDWRTPVYSPQRVWRSSLQLNIVKN